MSKIDVEKLAADLRADSQELFGDAAKELRTRIKENGEDPSVATFGFSLEAIHKVIEHNEKFTIQLLAKVVEELKK